MRVFAGDVIPGLTIVAPALPRPWVLPNVMGRKHRNRLVRLLFGALQGSEPELRLCEIRWGERDLVAMGRLRLPPAALVRWRIDPLPGIDRAAVMCEANRIRPDMAVFDFGRAAGEEALAWLGALKIEVLHRLIDALADHPPVAVAGDIVERLQELATVVRSPVDLIDGAEIMVQQAMLGQTARSAYAEACAYILAARFDDEDRDSDAGPMIRTLVQVAGEAEMTRESRALAERIGLVEPGADRPSPLADLLDVDGVMQRTQRLIVSRFPLRQSVRELSPEVAADESVSLPFEPDLMGFDMPGPYSPPVPDIEDIEDQGLFARIKSMAADVLAAFRSPVLQTAAEEVERGDIRSAAERVLQEMRAERDRSWSDEDATLAIYVLFQAAKQLAEKSPLNAAALMLASNWYEVGADIALSHNAGALAAVMLGAAGGIAERAEDYDRAERLLERARVHLAGTEHDKTTQIELQFLLGSVKDKLHSPREAQRAYETALRIAHELEDRSQQAELHFTLGRMKMKRRRWDDAQHDLERALELYKMLGDSDKQAAALSFLGLCHLRKRDDEQAITYLTHALESWPEHRHQDKAGVHLALGTLRMRRDDWTEARRELEQAVILWREHGSPKNQAIALRALGHSYARVHDFAAARAIYEAALATSRTAGDQQGEATALNALGPVLYRLGDLDGAFAAHDQALVIARSINNVKLEATALRCLGRLHVWTGALTESKDLFSSAIHLCRGASHRSGELLARLELASVAMALGEDAREQIEACGSILESVDKRSTRETYRVLEAALLWPSDPDKARRIWEEVADYRREAQPRATAAPVEALVAIANGQPLDRVAETLEDALGTTHPLPGRVREAPDADAALRAIMPFV